MCRETIDVNLFGPISCAARPFRHCIDRRFAAHAERWRLLRIKSRVVMLSKYLAVELAPIIRANTVCPRTVETAMIESLLRDAATAEPQTTCNAVGLLIGPDDIA